MLYISVEDFFQKVSGLHPMSREEEIECARRMLSGDPDARKQLIESYLPMAASHVRRAPAQQQSLSLVMHYVQALEKTVDSFNFLQNSEPFSHRLSWALRQAFTRHIVR